MGFNFGFFGTPEHKTFNYKPCYYDPEKEELKKKFGAVDGSADRDVEKGTYVPGSLVRGKFSDESNRKTRSSATRATKIIGMVSLILVVIAMIYIAKCWPAIINNL